jgi:hypothetical protein
MSNGTCVQHSTKKVFQGIGMTAFQQLTKGWGRRRPFKHIGLYQPSGVNRQELEVLLIV